MHAWDPFLRHIPNTSWQLWNPPPPSAIQDQQHLQLRQCAFNIRRKKNIAIMHLLSVSCLHYASHCNESYGSMTVTKTRYENKKNTENRNTMSIFLRTDIFQSFFHYELSWSMTVTKARYENKKTTKNRNTMSIFLRTDIFPIFQWEWKKYRKLQYSIFMSIFSAQIFFQFKKMYLPGQWQLKSTLWECEKYRNRNIMSIFLRTDIFPTWSSVSLTAHKLVYFSNLIVRITD